MDLELREYHFFFFVRSTEPLRVVAAETEECVEALSAMVDVELLRDEALEWFRYFSLMASLRAIGQAVGSSGRVWFVRWI